MSREQLVQFCLGGAGVMAFGLFWLFLVRRRTHHVEQLRRHGQKASAVVIDYEYKTDSDGDSVPYPLVRFDGPGGNPVTARTDFGGAYVPDIGQQVTVLFDPNRPEEAHIESQRSNQVDKLGWIIGWVIVGGAAAAVAVVLLLYQLVW